jgi:hypothetical protein
MRAKARIVHFNMDTPILRFLLKGRPSKKLDHPGDDRVAQLIALLPEGANE